MDSASIDRLARALSSSCTRRAGLGLLSAIGLFAADLSGEDAAAKKGRKKRNKKRRKKRADGQGIEPGDGLGSGPGPGPGSNPPPTDEICLPEQTTCLPGSGPRCCDNR